MIPLPLTELFSHVAALSWRAGWLIVVLVALRLVVRGRVPAQLWFGAWVLLAVRLLLPFAVPAGWSPYNLLADVRSVAVEVRQMLPGTTMTPPRETAAATASALANPASAASPASDLSTSSAQNQNTLASGTAASAATRPGPSTKSQTQAQAAQRDNADRPAAALAAPTALTPRTVAWFNTEIFAALWLAGAVALGLARLVAVARFRASLRGARELTGKRERGLLAREAAVVDVRRRIRLLETSAVDAPALFGLRRPRLLLPVGMAAQLTDEELRVVLRHELGHCRRRDLLVQTLLQAAVVVHWFNPLVWLAAWKARADCELACDEFVLRRGEESSAVDYGAVLLKVLGLSRGRPRPLAAVTMLGGRAQLAQRIRMIAGYRAATLGRVLAGVALLVIVMAIGITREAVAQPPAPQASPVAAPAAAPAPRESSAPAVSAGPAQDRDYVLQPRDQIKVTINQEEDLSRDVRLDGDSAVILPLIRKVELKGLTVAEAEKLIAQRYDGRYLKNPSVVVSVTEYARDLEKVSTVQVLGQVAAPGKIAFPRETGLTLVGAMTRAGGPSRLAKLGAVTLRRISPNGEVAVTTYNFDALIKGETSDVPLQPGDVINVPQRLNMQNITSSDTPSILPAFAAIAAQAQDQPATAVAVVKQLQPLIIEQQKKVDILRQELVEIKEATRNVSLSVSRDEVGQTFATARQDVERMEAAQKALEAKIAQFDAQRRIGVINSTELPFVASEPMIAELLRRITSLRVDLAAASRQYLERHPTLIKLTASFEATTAELDQALDRLRARWEAELSGLRLARSSARATLDRRQTESVQMDRLNLQYAQKEAELVIESSILAQIKARLTDVQLAATAAIATPAAPAIRVSVIGQVLKPGAIDFPAGEKPTVLDAIAAAGGITRMGNDQKVRILRKTDQGGLETIEINLRDILSGQNAGAQPMPLRAGDVINVPERLI